MASLIFDDSTLRRTSVFALRRTQASIFALVIAFAWLTNGAVASEEDEKSHGKALLAEGVALMDAGKAQEALAKFQEAYRIVPSPKVLFNVGLAHQALGHTVDALECFEGFLGELPDAPEDARTYAERQVAVLRANLSFVEVSATQPGAEVRIDDRPVGLLPLKRPAVAEPGPHTVTIRQNGKDVFRQEIVTVAGKSTRVFAVASPPTNVSSNAPRPWQRTAFWVAVGVAGVGLAGGVTEHIIYNGKSSDYKDLFYKGSCASDSVERSRCESLRNDASSARTWAWVGYSVAAVSAGAAVAFRLLEPETARSDSRYALSCGPSAGSIGLFCAGSY